MNRKFPTRWLLSAILPFAVLAMTGCDRPEAITENEPAEVAKDALGVKETDPTSETSATTLQKVDVIQETKVVDQETGKVLSDVKKITPVNVTKEKEVQTDIDVNVGKTVKTVE